MAWKKHSYLINFWNFWQETINLFFNTIGYISIIISYISTHTCRNAHLLRIGNFENLPSSGSEPSPSLSSSSELEMAVDFRLLVLVALVFLALTFFPFMVHWKQGKCLYRSHYRIKVWCKLVIMFCDIKNTDWFSFIVLCLFLPETLSPLSTTQEGQPYIWFNLQNEH